MQVMAADASCQPTLLKNQWMHTQSVSCYCQYLHPTLVLSSPPTLTIPSSSYQVILSHYTSQRIKIKFLLANRYNDLYYIHLTSRVNGINTNPSSCYQVFTCHSLVPPILSSEGKPNKPPIIPASVPKANVFERTIF